MNLVIDHFNNEHVDMIWKEIISKNLIYYIRKNFRILSYSESFYMKFSNG